MTRGEQIEPSQQPDLHQALEGSNGVLAQFLTSSLTAHCVIVQEDGRVLFCNGPFARRLGLQPEAVVGTPLSQHLTAHDADLVASRFRSTRTHHSEPVLLNLAGPTGMPTTLRCWIDIQRDRAVIVGEPEHEVPAAVDQQLLQVANELAVVARENARQKRELEDTHWHLKKISEILPICMDCGKVKTGAAKWDDVRTFLREHSRFLSHGYCPDCEVRLREEWDQE